MTKQEAVALYRCGRRPTVIVLMAQALTIRRQAQRIRTLEAESNKLKGQLALAKHHPETPSGMQPVYAKPEPSKRSRRPGAKEGHQGHCRPAPDKIDLVEEHALSDCPHCRGPLAAPVETRSRYIEDIPPTRPRVTQHVIPRYWCRACRKLVEPKVTQAFPGCVLGNNLVAFSCWLHYGMGVTVDKVVTMLNVACHFKVTAGGLIQAWQRLADHLEIDYKQLRKIAKHSPVLHADETGWRLSGKTHWLWCFTQDRLAYYTIARSRGSPVVRKVLGRKFDGTLVTDFYAAYNAVSPAFRQRCLVHLDRELDKVDLVDDSLAWKTFRKRLSRWIGDARRLGRNRSALPSDSFDRRRSLLDDRLVLLGDTADLQTKHARRLPRRLRRFRQELLTFLDLPGVPSNNNHAERQIRPAVIIRKNSYCNRSRRGARVQAAMMSVFQTLHLRSLDPMRSLRDGLADHLSSGRSPLAAEFAPASIG
ncbi:MAG: IS66 family transposase [Elusimicrobia bacterium]|nr:IS66 family transposase [Elusimicrobiota bacterium]